MILKGLRERACPENIYNLMSSYFSDRTVSLSWGGWSSWNIVFDSLLVKLEKLIGKMIMVYADALSALIACNTRASPRLIPAANTFKFILGPASG